MATSTTVSQRQEKVREAQGVLDEHLNALAEQMRQGKSEALLRYLDFTAKFHQYSFRNVLLILAQKPEATMVAGLRQWNRLGRHINAGEKGIMIFAPMTLKKRKGEEEQTRDEDAEPQVVTLFKIAHVFDVSQTDGEPVPELLHATGDATLLYPALQMAVNNAGILLEISAAVPGSNSAHGASYGGRIVLRQDLDQAQGFRTLAHEFAHEKLHWQEEKESRTVRELEADATAFVVCRHFGVYTDSADYLLLYDATPDVLLERLETVRNAAAQIIALIERELEVLTAPEDDCQPIGGHSNA